MECPFLAPVRRIEPQGFTAHRHFAPCILSTHSLTCAPKEAAGWNRRLRDQPPRPKPLITLLDVRTAMLPRRCSIGISPQSAGRAAAHLRRLASGLPPVERAALARLERRRPVAVLEETPSMAAASNLGAVIAARPASVVAGATPPSRTSTCPAHLRRAVCDQT